MRPYPRKLGWFTRAYATSDGRAFTDETLAINHQRGVNADKFIEKLECSLYSHQFKNFEDYERFIKCLGNKGVRETISSALARI